MSNKSKSLMKQDIQNFERMEKQYKQDIAELKRARADLEHLCAMLRDAFLSKGYTINDISGTEDYPSADRFQRINPAELRQY